MNSTQILCFLKAAELLNFTDAAAALHISQPAFSRNIALLESEWNVSLFFRSNKQKSTQLTPAGKAMYEGLQVIIQQYESLLKTAQSIHSGHAGSLKIGLISSDRIDDRMLRVLDFFHDHFPDVELALRRGSHSELVRWLYDNTVDLAFCLETEVADKPWVQSVPLYSIDSVLILSLKAQALKERLPHPRRFQGRGVHQRLVEGIGRPQRPAHGGVREGGLYAEGRGGGEHLRADAALGVRKGGCHREHQQHRLLQLKPHVRPPAGAAAFAACHGVERKQPQPLCGNVPFSL